MVENIVDRLIDGITKMQNPVCVGLDTKYEYLPGDFARGDKGEPLLYAAQNILEFNKALIDSFYDVVPSVKVQSAYYEMYGPAGVKAFYDTIAYAKQRGLIVISDVKRNDIGATAEAYSSAYLGEATVDGGRYEAFGADFATVNGYLGTDGIKPFVEDCEKYGRGIFVLVKTSNKSSGELQDLISGDKAIYEHMADMVEQWGKSTVGRYGYSAVGAVIGATYPEQAQKLRAAHPGMFVLIPGYGAQGGSAAGLLPNFDKQGRGGVVNNSRAILTAYKSEKYAGMEFDKAARQAVLDMRSDILDTFSANGISYK